MIMLILLSEPSPLAISLPLSRSHPVLVPAEAPNLQHLCGPDEAAQLCLFDVHRASVHELEKGRQIGRRGVAEE